MTEARLPIGLWVSAHLRRCAAEGIVAVLARRGSDYGGAVLVKINQLDLGCRILTQTRDLEGAPAWLAAFDGGLAPEPEADAYIARAVSRDPDLWVIEIEDRAGRHPFEGPIL